MKKIIIVFTMILISILVFCGFNMKRNLTKNNELIVETKNPSKNFLISRNLNQSQNKIANSDNILYSGKTVVLTYHHISSSTYGDITIKPERFESDLKMLKEKGFNIISLRDMINAMNGDGTMPNNAVVITFDDGIGSFYKYAYPLLKKYGMPGTNFIITTRNESYKPSTSDTNPLSPEEITEMYSSGLIDIESHTHDSHELVYINSDLKKGSKLANRIYNKETKTLESTSDYDKRVLADLTKSRELIYKYTGHYSDVLCFPFGIYNEHVIELAKQSGFKYFVTTREGVNRQSSKKDTILRIRSGDRKLDSEKLYNSIIDIACRKKAH